MKAVELLIDAVANDQITTILVDSDFLLPIRCRAVSKLPHPFDEVPDCALCTGMWVGLAQAVTKWLLSSPPNKGAAKRDGLGFILLSAFAIAGAGRLVRAAHTVVDAADSLTGRNL